MKIILSPFLRRLFFAIVASGLTFVSSLIITRLLAQGLGPEDFGAYSLANRLVSILTPVATLSVGIGLTRFLAMESRAEARAPYILTAAGGVLLSSGVIAGVLTLFPYAWSRIFFDQDHQTSLVVATGILLAGFSIHSILHACYFGMGESGKANLLQVVLGAAGPLAVAATSRSGGAPTTVIFATGAVYGISLLPLLVVVKRHAQVPPDGFRRRSAELLLYSAGRIPGVMAGGILMTLGPLLAPHFGSLRDSGNISIGLSIFRLMDLGTVAFGLVSLPRAAELMAQGKQEEMTIGVEGILSFVAAIGLYLSGHLFLWSEDIVRVWVGSGYSDAVPAMRIFSAIALPYLGFVMLKGVLDAVSPRPWNTVHIAAALIVAVPCSIAAARWQGLAGLSLGTAAGLAVLGILTFHRIAVFFPISWRTIRVFPLLALNAIALGIAIAAKELLPAPLPPLETVAVVAGVEGLLFGAYCLVQIRMNLPWANQVRERLHVRLPE